MKHILIVDDEKNIRLTLERALAAPEWATDTAVNGEEALQKLRAGEVHLVLLDLKMPGMDGMEVLRRVAEERPKVRVVIITAYGTIESAVEAMKLGAVDYLQKPFVPAEVRDLVGRVLSRDELDESGAEDYDSRIELVRKHINERRFDEAERQVRAAIGLDLRRPEAFNLLGALLEIRREPLEAQKQYRIALEVDPTYEPARRNLEGTTTWALGPKAGPISLGDEKSAKCPPCGQSERGPDSSHKEGS
jgi:DNA-binding response OmpR family regulator